MLRTVVMTTWLGLLIATPLSAGSTDSTLLHALDEDGRFAVLLDALEAAELSELLGGDERYTVFAPTDDAFDALPEGALSELMDDPAAIEAVLTYHIVPGMILADEIASTPGTISVLGQRLSFRGRTVNDVPIASSDNLARNGVYHVIDEVLMPDFTQIGEKPGIVETLRAFAGEGEFETLATALEATRLEEQLAQGTFTVFAPTDRAFASLPDGELERLLRDLDTMTMVLSLHVVPGAFLAEDLVRMREAPTLLGPSLAFVQDDRGVFVNGSLIIVRDLEVADGVIHVVDEVVELETQ